MTMAAALVKQTEGQLDQSTSKLQTILIAAADDKGEWHLPLTQQQSNAMRQVCSQPGMLYRQFMHNFCSFSIKYTSLAEKIIGHSVLFVCIYVPFKQTTIFLKWQCRHWINILATQTKLFCLLHSRGCARLQMTSKTVIFIRALHRTDVNVIPCCGLQGSLLHIAKLLLCTSAMMMVRPARQCYLLKCRHNELSEKNAAAACR